MICVYQTELNQSIYTVFRSGGTAPSQQPQPNTGSSYTPYTPQTQHTPVTPVTPGSAGGQVAHHRKAGDVHDLFEGMYRQSDPNQRAPVQPSNQPSKHHSNRAAVPSNRVAMPSNNSYHSPTVDPYKNPSHTNPMLNMSTTNGGITKINNEIIGPFYPSDKESADMQNANTITQKDFRPNTSLTSSTDSGISYGQTSQKMGSPPSFTNNPASSISSSISELSESFNPNSSNDSLPSPPPPQSPYSSIVTGFSSPNAALPSPPPPPLPSSEPPKWQPSTPTSAESNKEVNNHKQSHWETRRSLSKYTFHSCTFGCTFSMSGASRLDLYIPSKH